jgi:uncharacterized protein
VTEGVGSAARVPIREGLFVEADGRAQLIGSRCRETGEVFFPREAMNPRTMVDGTLEDHAFDGAGRLVAWTVVARGMPGFDSPYALATVQLDAGPSFICQLHDWQGRTLEPGQRVDLVIERIRTEKDGTAVVGPKMRPRQA